MIFPLHQTRWYYHFWILFSLNLSISFHSECFIRFEPIECKQNAHWSVLPAEYPGFVTKKRYKRYDHNFLFLNECSCSCPNNLSPNVVLLRGVTWTLEPDHSHGEEGPHGVERHDHGHGEDGHHGVERHGHRHHAEQIKVVTDPEERSSRLPPTSLASSWIAANEKVKNKRKRLTSIFCQPFQARHRQQAVGWVSVWCRCQDCPPSSSPRSRRTSRTTSASCAAGGGTGYTESRSLHRRRNSDTNFRMSYTN